MSFRSAHDRLAATPTGSSQHHRQGGTHQRNTVSFSSSATDLLRMRRRGNSNSGVGSPLSRSANNTVNLGDQFGSSVELASTATSRPTHQHQPQLRPSHLHHNSTTTTTTTPAVGPSPPRRTQSSPAVTVPRRTLSTATTSTTQARYERAADRREINRLGSNLDRVRGTMERRLMQHVDEANSSSELLGRAQRLTDRLAVLKRKLEMCFDLNDQIGSRRPGTSLDRESAMSQVMAARAMLGNNNYHPLDDDGDRYDLSGATRSLRHLTDTQRQQLESLVRSEPTVLGIGGGMGAVAHRGGDGSGVVVDTDGWQSYDPAAFVNDEDDDSNYSHLNSNHNNHHSAAAAASSSPSSSYKRRGGGGGGDSIVLSPHMILQQLMADVETDDAPPDFICPITQCVMIDPVTTSDGNIYERAAITQWFLSFQHRNKIPTSPLTNLELSDFTLLPHDVLRKAISVYLHGLMGGGGSLGGGKLMMGGLSGDGTTEWRNPTTTTSTIELPSSSPAAGGDEGCVLTPIPTTNIGSGSHGPLSEEPSRRFLSLLQSADTPLHDDDDDGGDTTTTTSTNPVTPPRSVVPRYKAPAPLPNHIRSGVTTTTSASSSSRGGGGTGVLRVGGGIGSSTNTPTPPNPSSLSSSSVTVGGGGGGGDTRPIWSSAVVPVDEPNSRFLNRLRMCEEADDDTLDMLALEGSSHNRGVGGNVTHISNHQHQQQSDNHGRGSVRRPLQSSSSTTNSRGGRGGGDGSTGTYGGGGGSLYEHRRLVPTNVFSTPSISLPTNTTAPTSSTRRGAPISSASNPTTTEVPRHHHGLNRGSNGVLALGGRNTQRPTQHHPRGSSSPANLNTRRKF